MVGVHIGMVRSIYIIDKNVWSIVHAPYTKLAWGVAPVTNIYVYHPYGWRRSSRDKFPRCRGRVVSNVALWFCLWNHFVGNFDHFKVLEWFSMDEFTVLNEPMALGVRNVHVHSSIEDDAVLFETNCILQVDGRFIVIESQWIIASRATHPPRLVGVKGSSKKWISA